MPEENTEALKPLSNREKAYIASYLKHFNMAQAARDCGCPNARAAEQGYQYMKRPNVKAEIQNRLDLQFISKDETKKLISDTAKSNLSNYFKEVEVLHTPRIKVSLQVIIDALKEDIAIEDEYRDLVDMDEETNDKWFKEQETRRKRILRYEIELRRNPLATRIIDGETVIKIEKQLDIDALVEDKEFAKIKTIKHTKDGIHVELHSPDAAKEQLARIHGLYEKDNAQSAINIISKKITFR